MSLAQVLSSIVKQIASGTPIWKVVVPASVHTDKSGLQITRNILFHNQERLLAFEQIDNLDDPVERLGTLIKAVIDPHNQIKGDKPFNPVLGEFIRETAKYDKNGEQANVLLEIEQISHHPPVYGYRLTGPNYVIETPLGIDGTKAFKIGVNHADIQFQYVTITMSTKSKGVMEYCQPGIRLNNLIFGKRENIMYGDFWVKDPSGMRVEGTIGKNLKFSGTIFNADGTVYDTFDGDFNQGIYLKKGKRKWFEPLTFSPVNTLMAEEDLKDPFYSENVWGKVFEHMRKSPPDYFHADKEKGVVEDAQRARAKARTIPFQSRFGLKCEYTSTEEN